MPLLAGGAPRPLSRVQRRGHGTGPADDPGEQAVLPALDGAPPALAGLAAALRTSNSAEPVHLRQSRERAGLPTTGVHAGHQHRDQATELARGEQRNGTDAATEEIAASVESSRRDQLTWPGQG
ncbi:hypothetical protein [Lentzea sp. NEAU-D7]|uniref:hypothetical protein n=1 Tax=Lentzea sp. NEAU-D7 TaxID=2994667 RepID=UPI00224B1648|nr:hypothetical protein [Lentzea sp. NEAU-D7]